MRDNLVSVETALEHILNAAWPSHDEEIIPTDLGLGRVLARDQRATHDVPAHDNSAVDGYALHSSDSGEQCRIRFVHRICAGDHPPTLPAGFAARIFTGAAIPPGADTVIMQEACVREGNDVVLPRRLSPGENIRPRGNDITAGSVVLKAGTRLGPVELGVAASIGLTRLPVLHRLRIGVFSSGNEVRDPGQHLGPGQVYNSNRYLLRALIQSLGCEFIDFGIVPDKRQAVLRVLTEAAKLSDLIVSSGGVSVGEEDHVVSALPEIGHPVLWRVAIKPGKPFLFGQISGRSFFGLPGNPVAVLVTFLILVRPFIFRVQGRAEVTPHFEPVVAGFTRRSRNRREYLRVRLEHRPGHLPVAHPHEKQGSDVLTAAVWSDGLLVIPEDRDVNPGAVLEFVPFASLLY